MLTGMSTASEFMSRKLVTVSSQSNVSKAVKLMVDYNIGGVIVTDDEGPVGIFTERDLLSNVLNAGKSLEEPILMQVMTPSPNHLSSKATLIETAKMMTQKKGRLVVFDDRPLGIITHPLGIITATDIIREIQKEGRQFDFKESSSRIVYEAPPRTRVADVVRLMAEKRIGSVIVSEGQFPRGIFTERDLLRSVLTTEFRMDGYVENFATHHLITAGEGITGYEAAYTMRSRRIKRLPLTRENGEICGIVTARDLVEAFANSV